MIKIILLVLVFLLGGCQKDPYLFSLEDKYYQGNEFIEATYEDINLSLQNKESFLLYTYNNSCSFQVPCADIFQEFMDKYNISILSISFQEFKETSLYEEVKYAPSVIIVYQGKVVSYLKADSDDDNDKYQDVDVFTNWIKEYVIIN